MSADSRSEAMMREALRLAREAFDDGETPVGAVVALGDTVVGRGRNRREKSHSALAHAEVEAIDEACRRLGGWRLWECDLYVTLEPCPMCAGAAVNARVKRIVYGARDAKNGACGSVLELPAATTYRPAVTGGVLEEACGELLTAFFRELRERPAAQEAPQTAPHAQNGRNAPPRGMFLVRVDGPVVTYDIRTRLPGNRDVMPTGVIHTAAHIFADFVRRQGRDGSVITFAPTACRTGFRLLTTGLTHAEALQLVQDAFAFIATFEGEIPDAPEPGCECDHDLAGAKREAADQAAALTGWTTEKMLI
ncbi:MAG: S-ribosylhomocysteine lyase [Clostridia bacterium]|nr:S-ribosylhomocysteine lyase [Clostridia bacterium]